ncbi:hypothetical protein RDI58_028882 [Solanum bulbocastanum]|uniref:Disease resistance protein winged helix domain-containing protein n=1 Tax=Solanum bulbocastanum TaxID=147425 RepID=A0AAN8SSN2_SOLBU
MQLSYDNLPDCLKPCLLYLGMFPEDAIIPVSKLISLWISEDFVQNIESGRLIEEAAEGYLMDLISSNLVMVSERKYKGKVKYCQEGKSSELQFQQRGFRVCISGLQNTEAFAPTLEVTDNDKSSRILWLESHPSG